MDLRLSVWMFAAGRRFFLGSHGTLVAVSAPFMMPLRDSDIPMNFSFTFCNKQPFTPKVSCGPFPALTIALLVSASGFDTCVHTHGASMKLVDGFPVKLKGSDTAPTAHSAALVCCIGEGRMIWVWLGAAVSGCTCCLPCCVPSALYVCVFDVCVRELCTPQAVMAPGLCVCVPASYAREGHHMLSQLFDWQRFIYHNVHCSNGAW